MKWRNQLLALLLLVAFAGVGVIYFQHWVVQKPFGIILFIGEGLSPARLAATRIYAGGADTKLALDSMEHVALVRNYSRDFATPDRAAAATAISTGTKVNNGTIARNGEGKSLRSIVELARNEGRAIGLITDGNLTDPTCAAFYAHPADANDTDGIARELVEHGRIDIALGGGLAHFVATEKGGGRADKRDLLLELGQSGFDVVQTRAALEAIAAWKYSKLFGVFSKNDLAFANQVEERNVQPSLSDMTRRAIELLQYNAGGYLLIVDAALMRKAAEANQGERTLNETAELDRAVLTARRYAGTKSTIIVCGDVAVGGMSLNGAPFCKDSGIAVIGLNSAGQPWITWAAGPNGVRPYGAAKMPNQSPSEQAPTEPLEPGAFYTKAALPTVDDVVALGTGRGTEALKGSIDQTAIFEILRDQL